MKIRSTILLLIGVLRLPLCVWSESANNEGWRAGSSCDGQAKDAKINELYELTEATHSEWSAVWRGPIGSTQKPKRAALWVNRKLGEESPEGATRLEFSGRFVSGDANLQFRVKDSSNKIFTQKVKRLYDFTHPTTQFVGVVDLRPIVDAVAYPISEVALVFTPEDGADEMEPWRFDFSDLKFVQKDETSSINIDSLKFAPTEKTLAPLNRLLGICCRYDQTEFALKNANELGIGWLRRDLSWDEIVGSDGQFDFKGYDILYKKAYAHGVRILGILDYGHRVFTKGKMTPPRSSKELGLFSNYVDGVLSHFREYDCAFEIWNEPDYKRYWAGRPDPKEYNALLAAATKQSAVIRGDSPLLSGGVSTLTTRSRNFADKFSESTSFANVSAFAIHPYGLKVPENISVHMQWLQNVANKTLTKGIWCSEWGWSSAEVIERISGDNNVARQTQARYVVRSVLVGWWSGLQSIVLYELVDGDGNSRSREANYGLYEHNLSPKPAATALAYLSAISKNAVLVGGLSNGALHVVKLVSADASIMAAWVEVDRARVYLHIGDGWKVYDMYGKQMTPIELAGQAAIEVGESAGVIYFVKHK